MFADPFNTTGLVIDPSMHDGFRFEVHDLIEEKKIIFNTPEEIYDMLVFIGAPSRYVIKHVFRKGDNDEPVAVTSTQRLFLMAGRYVGKDDPVMAVRCQSGLPAVGEVLEPFAFPYTVAGGCAAPTTGRSCPWARIRTHLPASTDRRAWWPWASSSQDGKLVGPRDMFADPSYDNARQKALDVADYMRRARPLRAAPPAAGRDGVHHHARGDGEAGRALRPPGGRRTRPLNKSKAGGSRPPFFRFWGQPLKFIISLA